MSLKSKILKLKGEGFTYKQIQDTLGCSKGVISYHCKCSGISNGYVEVPKSIQGMIREYYKDHTITDTVRKFNLSPTTIKKYGGRKFTPLAPGERKRLEVIRVTQYRQRMKQMAVDYKGGKCCRCNYDDCIWALDFHHLDPSQKKFSVGMYTRLSWDEIKSELDKCIMICANCHRKEHYQIYWSEA